MVRYVHVCNAPKFLSFIYHYPHRVIIFIRDVCLFSPFIYRREFPTYEQIMLKILFTNWLLQTLKLLRNSIKWSFKYWWDSIWKHFPAIASSLRTVLYCTGDDVSIWLSPYGHGWLNRVRNIWWEWNRSGGSASPDLFFLEEFRTKDWDMGRIGPLWQSICLESHVRFALVGSRGMGWCMFGPSAWGVEQSWSEQNKI